MDANNDNKQAIIVKSSPSQASAKANDDWKVKAAVAFHFNMVGFVIGNWVARIPSVKDVHHLSDAMFGLVLVTALLGACLCLPLVSPLISRFGSAVGILVGSMATIVLVPIIGVTQFGIGLLIVGMIGLGFGMGMADVSMNAHATSYELRTSSHSMGLFHANYAIGSFLGAITGGIFAKAEVSPLKNFVLVSLICLPLALLMFQWLMPKEEESQLIEQHKLRQSIEHSSHPSDVEQTPVSEELENSVKSTLSVQPTSNSYCNFRSEKFQITLLCAIAFVSSLGEGSVNDWSTIYFVQNLNSTELTAAIGYACFEVMVALGRLYSDSLLERYEGKYLLQCAGWLACIGLFFVVASTAFEGKHEGDKPPQNSSVSIAVSMVAFAVCGIGISVCSPIVMHLAARVPGVDPADAITNLTTCIYMAMLLGPPLIGGLSSLLGSLQWALLVDAVGLLIIVISAMGMRSTKAAHAYRELDTSSSAAADDASIVSPIHTTLLS